MMTQQTGYSPSTNSSSLDCLNLIVQSINTPSSPAAITSVPSIVITPPDIKATMTTTNASTPKINYLNKFQQKCTA